MTGKAQGRETEGNRDAGGGARYSGAARVEDAAPDIREAAAYIYDISADLRDLANAARLPLLAYLLDMARLEAKTRMK